MVSFGTNIFRKAFKTSSKIPADIASRIKKISDEPLAWWTGQVMHLAIKYVPKIWQLIDQEVEKFKSFEEGPIVGVHIRRTDQLEFFPKYNVTDYMKHVENYYDQLEMTQVIHKRRIYIATEEPAVIKEIEEKYPEYDIISNKEAATIARNLTTRWSPEALIGIVTDLHMLSQTDYVVCAFSSNVCLFLLENFQVQHPDSSNKLVSIDTMYINDYRVVRNATAIYRYNGESKYRNFNLEPGDRVMLFRGHFKNGRYCGLNMRIGIQGCFPYYTIEVDTETYNSLGLT